MYDRLRTVISNSDLFVKADILERLKEDLTQVKRIVTDNGKIVYEAKRNSKTKHSDLTSALVLALGSSHDQPSSFSLPQSYIPYSSFGLRTSRLV